MNLYVTDGQTDRRTSW